MATTSGTLVSKVSSTAGSPTVNYSATYTATRATSATANVRVTLSLKCWLNSSASRLGNGIKLTVYARMNGGAWSSAILKTTSQTWSGTTQHTAGNIALTGDVAANKATIEFYVTRSGSTYSGTAGNLGSSSNPKSYTATLPTYSAATYSVTYSVSGDVPAGYSVPIDSTAYASGATVTAKAVPSISGYAFNGWLLNGEKKTSFTISANTTLTGVWTRLITDKYVYVKVNGTWKRAIAYVKSSGAWKKTEPYIKINSTWKHT